MRILNITAQKPHSTGSGVYLSELMKSFAENGVEQGVVAGVYSEDVFLLPQGVETFFVFFKQDLPFPVVGMSDEMPYESTKYKEMNEEMTLQFQECFYRQVHKAVEKIRPDLILCHHLYFLTALVRAWFPDRVVMGICHNTDLLQLKQIPFQRAWIQHQIGRLNQIFALHQQQKEEIQRMFGVSGEKITILGAGFNHRIFCPGKGKRETKGIRLVFAGKISKKKGVKSLMNILSYLPPSRSMEMILVGGAGDENEYQEIVEASKKVAFPVRFLGKLSQEKLAKIYQEGDVFLLPSFAEGLPLTVIEALACGNKVVMSRFEGVKEWLEANTQDACVLYVPLPQEGDAKGLEGFERAFASKIQAALEIKQEKPAKVEEISWNRIARKIIEVGRK